MIAYAGFLAQLGYHGAATLALHNWLPQAQSEQFPSTWYELRARFMLALYLEEWIRTRGDSAPLALRQYHIDNFETVIKRMKKIAAVSEVQKLSGDARLEVGPLSAIYSGDDGICNAANAGERELLGNIYQSYISALAGYVDHSLKHPENAKRHASEISEHTQELNRVSLRCLDSGVQHEKRAEFLEYYGRNQLNLVENIAPLKGADALREQIKNAEQVVQLALEFIDKEHQDEEQQKKTTQNFLSKVSSSSISERYESLLNTQQRLKEKERELSRN
jgi:hypothetical protein